MDKEKLHYILPLAKKYSELADIGSPEAFKLRLKMIIFIETEQLFVEMIQADEKKRVETMNLLSQLRVQVKYKPGASVKKPEDIMIPHDPKQFKELLAEGSIQARGLQHFFCVDGIIHGLFNEAPPPSKLKIQK